MSEHTFRDQHVSSRYQLLNEVRARRNSMMQVAEEITQALGLPSEATYEVLSILYGGDNPRIDLEAIGSLPDLHMLERILKGSLDTSFEELVDEHTKKGV